MKTHSRIILALITCGLLALGVGCGSEPAAENNGGTQDADNNGGEDVDEVEVPQDWAYEAEYNLRFTAFKLRADSPGSGLNGTLSTNLERQHDKYPIVVLVHLKDIDTEAGTLDLRGGAGLKADLECDPAEVDGGECEYKWDPETAETYNEDAPFDAETGKLEGALDQLDFIATFERDGEVNKAVVPVKEIVFDAELKPFAYKDEQGEVVVEVGIKDADLQGYVTLEDAENSTVEVSGAEISLDAVLQKGKMNHDVDGDGEEDAWMLNGVFSANETIVVE